MKGALPVAACNATAASRSQFDPGKTMTLAFMFLAISPLSSPGLTGRSSNHGMDCWMPACARMTLASRTQEKTNLVSSRLELIGVILDDGVGEELLAHALDLRAGAAGIALGHLDLDIFALAHVANRAEAERVQRAGDGLALRIEYARLQRDGNARLHSPSPRPYFERTSTGPVRARIGLSTCSPSRRATS